MPPAMSGVGCCPSVCGPGCRPPCAVLDAAPACAAPDAARHARPWMQSTNPACNTPLCSGSDGVQHDLMQAVMAADENARSTARRHATSMNALFVSRVVGEQLGDVIAHAAAANGGDRAGVARPARSPGAASSSFEYDVGNAEEVADAARRAKEGAFKFDKELVNEAASAAGSAAAARSTALMMDGLLGEIPEAQQAEADAAGAPPGGAPKPLPLAWSAPPDGRLSSEALRDLHALADAAGTASKGGKGGRGGTTSTGGMAGRLASGAEAEGPRRVGAEARTETLPAETLPARAGGAAEAEASAAVPGGGKDEPLLSPAKEAQTRASPPQAAGGMAGGPHSSVPPGPDLLDEETLAQLEAFALAADAHADVPAAAVPQPGEGVAPPASAPASAAGPAAAGAVGVEVAPSAGESADGAAGAAAGAADWDLPSDVVAELFQLAESDNTGTDAATLQTPAQSQQQQQQQAPPPQQPQTSQQQQQGQQQQQQPTGRERFGAAVAAASSRWRAGAPSQEHNTGGGGGGGDAVVQSSRAKRMPRAGRAGAGVSLDGAPSAAAAASGPSDASSAAAQPAASAVGGPSEATAVAEDTELPWRGSLVSADVHELNAELSAELAQSRSVGVSARRRRNGAQASSQLGSGGGGSGGGGDDLSAVAEELLARLSARDAACAEAAALTTGLMARLLDAPDLAPSDKVHFAK
eukprot:351951-Chlamydomonas_euryale.AAC.6